MAALAMLLASAVGITLGALAAIRENRLADRAVLTLSTLGVTVPNFVLAPILVVIFYLQLGVLPATWEVNTSHPVWLYYVLPVVILAARPMALLTRLTRASMVETLKQEFVRTAIAKGVPPARLFFKHALRNAMIPVLTVIGLQFGAMLAGAVVTETIFAGPGVGRLLIQAITTRDYLLVQGCILAIGLTYIAVNLLTDVLYSLANPRIRQ